jgi:hypothetical protein
MHLAFLKDVSDVLLFALRGIRFYAEARSGEKCSALWLTTGGSDSAL